MMVISNYRWFVYFLTWICFQSSLSGQANQAATLQADLSSLKKELNMAAIDDTSAQVRSGQIKTIGYIRIGNLKVIIIKNLKFLI